MVSMIFISLIPVQAVAPIKYYEIDSDVELRGAIFVDVDPAGFYGYFDDGIIRIMSDIHHEAVSIRFKGIALGSRLKKYNGFNVGYTHVADDGIITNVVKPLEIDAQGFAYLTTDFSTVIINGMTGITTTTITELSGNESIPVPNGSSYNFNITNNQVGVWGIDGYDYPNRKLLTIDQHSELLTDYQINKTVSYESEMQFNMNDIIFTYYGNDTLIPYLNKSISLNSSADVWLKIPVISNITDTQIWMYYGNSTVAMGSNATGMFGTVGKSSVGVGTDYMVGHIISNKITVSDDIIIMSVSLYAGTGGGNWKAGLYNDSAGVAGSYILSNETNIPLVTGWNTLDISEFTLSSGVYHIAFSHDSSSSRLTTTAGSDVTRYHSHTYGDSYPDPFGAASAYGVLFDTFLTYRQYSASVPTWAVDGGEQVASGLKNITVSVTGDSNEQFYNTSQSREFSLTPSGTTNNIDVNTTSTDYDVTVTVYWTEDTTLQSEITSAGYARQYINYTPSDNTTSTDLTSTFATIDFDIQDHVGNITSTLNGVAKTTIRDGQNVNSSVGALVAGTAYLWNITVPYNNVHTVGVIDNKTAYLGDPIAFNASSFSDPEGLGIDTQFWDFGDGSNSSLSDLLHTYTSEGVFAANYSVTEIATILPHTVTQNFTVTVLPPVYTVSGYIFGVSNTTLIGALITNNVTSETIYSNISGFYTLDLVSNGSVRLNCSLDGYTNNSIIVNVAGDTPGQNISLSVFNLTDWMLWGSLEDIHEKLDTIESQSETSGTFVLPETFLLIAFFVIVRMYKNDYILLLSAFFYSLWYYSTQIDHSQEYAYFLTAAFFCVWVGFMFIIYERSSYVRKKKKAKRK